MCYWTDGFSWKKNMFLCTKFLFSSGVEQKTWKLPISPSELNKTLCAPNQLVAPGAVFALQCWSVMRQSCLGCDHEPAQLYMGHWCLEGGKWAGCNCFFQSSQGTCRDLAGPSFLLLYARQKEAETRWGRNWFWGMGVLIAAEIPLSPLSYSKSSENAVML